MGMLRKSALAVGVLLIIAGLGGVGIYAAGLIDIIIEQPADRSWLFWGAGFLFFGILALGSGVALLVVWRNLSRQERPQPPESTTSR